MLISNRPRLFGRRWFIPRVLGATLVASFFLIQTLIAGESSGCGPQGLGWWCGASPERQYEKRSASEVWRGKYQKKIHLLTQWYIPRNISRASEIIRVLKLNTENQYIDHIHFLQPVEPANKGNLTGGYPENNTNNAFYHSNQTAWAEKLRPQLLDVDQTFPWLLLLSKLVVSPVSKSRLLVSDALQYANTHLRHEGIALLANLDIYYDESLIEVFSEESDLDYHTSFFLSRYEENSKAENNSLIGTQCGPKFVGSHDVIAFVPPIPEKLIKKCKFEIGSWGVENRILWEFEQAGIRGRNPCMDIRTWHVHLAGANKEWMPVVNTDGKSSVAFPDRLISKFKPDYPWEVQEWESKNEKRRKRLEGKAIDKLDATD